MKKQYISPIIEFHSADLQTFMENIFSENEPDVKERGRDFEEEEEEYFEEDNNFDIQKSLW